VDDIKGVQDNAHLQRLAMQVQLNMDVEKRLPEWMRRKLMVKGEKVFPNKNKRKNIAMKILYDDFTLQKITRNFVNKKSEVRRTFQAKMALIVISFFQSDSFKLQLICERMDKLQDLQESMADILKTMQTKVERQEEEEKRNKKAEEEKNKKE
jgi:transient receptor potential cation channel subfamily A protein 1